MNLSKIRGGAKALPAARALSKRTCGVGGVVGPVEGGGWFGSSVRVGSTWGGVWLLRAMRVAEGCFDDTFRVDKRGFLGPYHREGLHGGRKKSLWVVQKWRMRQ